MAVVIPHRQPLGFNLGVNPERYVAPLVVSCFIAAIPMGIGYAIFGKWGAAVGYVGGAVLLAPLIAGEGAW